MRKLAFAITEKLVEFNKYEVQKIDNFHPDVYISAYIDVIVPASGAEQPNDMAPHLNKGGQTMK